MDYEYEGSWEGDDEDVPYVELELDITDVHTLYRAVCSAIDVWPGGRPLEQQRLTAMKDFLYRIVLEYKYKVQEWNLTLVSKKI